MNTRFTLAELRYLLDMRPAGGGSGYQDPTDGRWAYLFRVKAKLINLIRRGERKARHVGQH